MLQPAEQRATPRPRAPAVDAVDENDAPQTWAECLLALTGVDVRRCPRCEHGRMLPAPLEVVNGHTRQDGS